MLPELQVQRQRDFDTSRSQEALERPRAEDEEEQASQPLCRPPLHGSPIYVDALEVPVGPDPLQKHKLIMEPPDEWVAYVSAESVTAHK